MADANDGDFPKLTFDGFADHWWCPYCSYSDTDFLCDFCRKLLLKSEEDIRKNKLSKSRKICSKCSKDDGIIDGLCEGCIRLHLKTIKNKITLVNSRAAAPGMLTSLTVRERRNKHEIEAVKIFEQIMKYCKERKTHFVDDQFPPLDKSIGHGSFTSVSQWLRINEVAPVDHEDQKLSWTVLSSPSPSDIQQGALGNCWLVAAIALIAEKPRLLEHILLTKDFNKEGVYLVRVCHNGLWKTIIVDDCFPCTRHKTLVFTKAKNRQLYVPLIEKACAKLFGSYASLRSGHMHEGLQLLTGTSSEYIDLNPQDQTIDQDLIWAKLLSACEAKALIGTSTSSTIIDAAEYDRVHIHSNHAFSILAAHALSGRNARFVLVRDPHSHSRYTEAEITNDVFQQLRRINSARRSTGAFWISWHLYLRYFSSITISAYNSNFYDIREQGEFTRSSTEQIKCYKFYLSQTSEINISLIYHRHDRSARYSHTQSFVLCDADELASQGIVGRREHILVSKRGTFTYWSGILQPGTYILIPFSISFWYDTRSPIQFTLVVHSSTQLTVSTKMKRATLLSDCLISVAKANAHKAKRSKDYVSYTTPSQMGIKIFVMENLSTDKFLDLDVSVTHAKNIRHSRHKSSPYHTHDCIPPRHCQIIFMTEWVDKHGEKATLSYSYTTIHQRRESNPDPSIDFSKFDIHTHRAF